MTGVVEVPTAAKRDVLVVEDEAATRRALSLLLEMNGFVTAVAGSGEEALTILGAGPMPAFALVDLDLPGMNGIELISHLQKLGAELHPVLLTAADKDRVARVSCGRRLLYMQKPVDFTALLCLLRQLQVEN